MAKISNKSKRSKANSSKADEAEAKATHSQQQQHTRVQKPSMSNIPVKIVMTVLSHLPIKDTWRLRSVSKDWQKVLSSKEVEDNTLMRWETHVSTDEADRSTNESKIRTLRQHQRGYPAVRVMHPILAKSVKQPFHQRFDTTAEPMLSSNMALVCTNKDMQRFTVVDMKRRRTWDVPLPTTYNSKQDKYRGKAITTENAAFLRDDVCYVFEIRSNSMHPLVLPSSRQHIQMLAVTAFENGVAIVCKEGEKSMVFVYFPHLSFYIHLLSISDDDMVEPSRGPLCAVYLDKRRCHVFFITKKVRRTAYDLVIVWNDFGGSGYTEYTSIPLIWDVSFEVSGTLTCHSTGTDKFRIEIAGDDGKRGVWHNIIVDMKKPLPKIPGMLYGRAFPRPELGYGDTFWKGSMIGAAGRGLEYRELEGNERTGLPRRMHNCFAMQNGVSLLSKSKTDVDREQYVATNESYMITGKYEEDMFNSKLVWDFFSWDENDSGIRLVEGTPIIDDKIGQKFVPVNLAQ